ncbi:MAG: response regulator transcription factor [Steroidobacteraceae bacterium]
MSAGPTVYLIDDDPSVRDALVLLLNLRGIATRAFGSADGLLESVDFLGRGCIVTDLKMPGKSGLELLNQLAGKGIRLPIVILTAHGDVSTTRAALRGGAFDFLEKPVDEDILVDVLTHALAEDQMRLSRQIESDAQRAKFGTLTRRERQVFELLGRGLQNKEVAAELCISARTVEVYKARMMAKLKCDNLADVVRIAITLSSEGRLSI